MTHDVIIKVELYTGGNNTFANAGYIVPGHIFFRITEIRSAVVLT